MASNQEFDALRAQWTVLHAAAGLAAFQSFEWMRTWWRHFGVTKRFSLHILVVESAERAVAIFPCMIERARIAGVLPIRRLFPIGRGESDYLELIVLPEFREAVCEAVARHIIERVPCDVVRFSEAREGSPLHRVLELLQAAGFETTRVMREQCPRTALLPTWDETLNSIPKDKRKSLSYIERRLGKTFQVQFRRVGPGDDIEAELKTFMEMHQRRWEAVGEPGAFARQQTRDFHLDVARQFHEKGWLVLGFLMLDGKTVTSMYAFKLAHQLQFYLSGKGDEESFEPFRKYSPGVALHVYCMQEMIAEGVTVYDFLRGTEQYKYDLGAIDVPHWNLSGVRNSVRARLLSRLYAVYARLGDSVKARLSASASRKDPAPERNPAQTARALTG